MILRSAPVLSVSTSAMRGSDAEKPDVARVAAGILDSTSRETLKRRAQSPTATSAATADSGALALGVVSGCRAAFAVGGVNRHTADIVKGRKRPEGTA